MILILKALPFLKVLQLPPFFILPELVLLLFSLYFSAVTIRSSPRLHLISFPFPSSSILPFLFTFTFLIPPLSLFFFPFSFLPPFFFFLPFSFPFLLLTFILSFPSTLSLLFVLPRSFLLVFLLFPISFCLSHTHTFFLFNFQFFSSPLSSPSLPFPFFFSLSLFSPSLSSFPLPLSYFSFSLSLFSPFPSQFFPFFILFPFLPKLFSKLSKGGRLAHLTRPYIYTTGYQSLTHGVVLDPDQIGLKG